MICKKTVILLSILTAILFSLSLSPVIAADQSSSELMDIANQAVAESGLGEMVNINSATPEMLAAIPGIGPQIGEAIAMYREANGAFTQIEDLLKVEGIDEKLLEMIKPFLKI